MDITWILVALAVLMVFSSISIRGYLRRIATATVSTAADMRALPRAGRTALATGSTSERSRSTATAPAAWWDAGRVEKNESPNAPAVVIRPYGEADAAATLAIFLAAITETAAADYSPEQIQAWARPLFERSGFMVEEERHPVKDGVQLTNFRMKKLLR